MHAYLVTAPNGDRRYAGTNALAKEARKDFVENLGVKKSAVTIVEVDLPTPKAEMLDFINGLCKELDKPKDGEDASA